MHAPRVHAPQIPFYLEKNLGQAPDGVRYIAHAGSETIYLTGQGAMISLAGRSLLRMTPAGGATHPQLVAEDKRPGILNYFIGNNPRHWHTNVPTYGRVTYRNVYPGIDLAFHGQDTGLEYDWVVRAGADPGRIRMRVRGAGGMLLDRTGALHFGGSSVLQTAPVAYQVAGLKLTPSANLLYGTHIGGEDFEYANGLAVDTAGRAYVAGSSSSADFPHTLLDGLRGGQDAVAFQLSPQGNALRYSVVTGGPGDDAANAIALDQHRNAYVAIGLDEGGKTDDVDILKISPGGKIVRRKIMGGPGDDEPFGIAVSRAGNVTVVGSTRSPACLDSGAIQPRYGGNTDAFVLQLNRNFAQNFGSYLGGGDYDRATGVALDASGSAYVVGWTGSGPDFPHTDTTPHLSNITCAFIVKIAPDGSRYDYSTLIGSTRDRVIGNAIVVDGQGQITIGGYIDGGLPAYNSVSGMTAFHGGLDDAFLATLSADGKRLVSTSDFGGGANDAVYGVALGGSGNLFATGQTTSVDFPHTRGQAFNSSGKRDGFLVKIDPHH
jgi:hypothetical protein